MVKIIKIKIEGMGSIVEKLVYKFDRPGLNIIKGRVGSGKTTILDALLWAFYGKRTKAKSSVEPWEWTKTNNYRGTKVEVELEIDDQPYTIVRCAKFKGKVGTKAGGDRLVLFEGEKESPIRDKNDLKKYIAKLIGYSEELFKASVLFGQRVNRFMDEDGPTKKKILEEAFSIDYIGQAAKLAQLKLTKINQEYSLARQKMYDLDERLLELGSEYKVAEEKMELQASNRKKRIKDLKAKIKGYKEELSNEGKIKAKVRKKRLEAEEIKQRIEFLPRPDSVRFDRDQLFKKEWTLQSLQGDVTDLIEDIDRLKEQFKTVPQYCDTCNQRITHAMRGDRKRKIQGQIAHAKESLKSKERELEQFKESFKAFTERLASKEEEVNEYETLRDTLKRLEEEDRVAREKLESLSVYHKLIKECRADIVSIRAEEDIDLITPILKKEAKLNEEAKALAIPLNKLKAKKENLEWAIKGPLSNNGLKANIFDSMLGQLNAYLAQYEYIIGFKLFIGIDMESAKKDPYTSITKQGEEVLADDLSGGEKQLSNLCIAISQHEVNTQTRPINILVMDECFEGLGNEEIDLVAELVRAIAAKKSMHIVTHREFEPVNTYLTQVKKDDKGHTQIYSKLENN